VVAPLGFYIPGNLMIPRKTPLGTIRVPQNVDVTPASFYCYMMMMMLSQARVDDVDVPASCCDDVVVPTSCCDDVVAPASCCDDVVLQPSVVMMLLLRPHVVDDDVDVFVVIDFVLTNVDVSDSRSML
jgi:hypothetical protein